MNKLTFYVCYNEDCKEFPKQIQDEYPELNIVAYNENHYAEKKKTYKIKGGYSARMTPFILVLGEDNSFKKAFYSEDHGCTLEKVKEWLNTL